MSFEKGYSEFHVQINKGEVHIITQRSGLYWHAVVHALATMEYPPSIIHPDENDLIKIWVPHLVEAGYGPYWYEHDHHTVGTTRLKDWP